ncbi:hypothetical protein [Streptomyces zaomyceticus]|uniref:hypothetical protein n=1 Tax=Streptomyces zaomyceticus TaxID=68286 RepID=UPI002E1077F6|nr:hypothetical protein OG237_06330 [Streptomyces zaomyceticus]
MNSRQHHRPWLRHYAAEQILADLARWRADWLVRQTLNDRHTCQALWQLPAHQPARKETEQ